MLVLTYRMFMYHLHTNNRSLGITTITGIGILFVGVALAFLSGSLRVDRFGLKNNYILNPFLTEDFSYRTSA